MNLGAVLQYKGYIVSDELHSGVNATLGSDAITGWSHPTDPQPDQSQLDAWAAEPGYATWLAEHGGDALLTTRREAKEDADDLRKLGLRTRALLLNANRRINWLINRVTQLQAALDAVKASAGPADNIRAAIPGSWLPTAARTLPEAIQAYKDDIAAGEVDT